MSLLLLLSSQTLTGTETAAHASTRGRTYTQGAAVQLRVDIMDADTRAAVLSTSIDDLVLTILQSDQDSEVRSLSDNLLDIDPDVQGRYSATVDTSPAAGEWRYQFATVGDDAAVAIARFHVREAVPMGI